MMRRVAVWLALCLPVFGHELAVDIELQQPDVLLRTSYGPGEPAARVAVVASAAVAQDNPAISGETDEGGAFAFQPTDEGEWLVRVDDGYGHVATRTVVVNWANPENVPSEQSSLWARTGAGLVLIFGLTAFAVWGRRRIAVQQR